MKVISEKLCAICGTPSNTMYCTRKCADFAWKNSKTFLNKKCKICQKPCHNLYCSVECTAKSKETIYKENCRICGEEFIYHKTGYKKRGGMIYCSYKCAASVYNFDDKFFFRDTNISIIYETLGFLFANGNIMSYVDNKIDINSTKRLLDKFIEITKTTYPIKTVKVKQKLTYRLTIRSKIILNYLYDIGLSHTEVNHYFPVILDEYKKFFIKGYMNSPNCFIYPKKDHNLVIIISKSYHIIRTIAEVTGGDMVTKKLEFCCAFKDYERYYTKW